MQSLQDQFTALVVGASGGIGKALAGRLNADMRCARLVRLDRVVETGFDLRREETIELISRRLSDEGLTLDLVIDATGVLTVDCEAPEKKLSALDPAIMAEAFAINTIGPALLFKHFVGLLPRGRKSIFATLSARVGSIGDNRLGGWISYRSSKAALNQVVRTASIEISHRRPHAVCAALHPGTVATSLSAPYVGSRTTLAPDHAAQKILVVLDQLNATASGGFFDYDGRPIEW